MKNKIFNSNSIYQLLLFLLLTKKEDRKLFIVGDTFPEKIKKNLDNVLSVGNDAVKFNSKNKVSYFFKYITQLIKLKKVYNNELRNLENNEIYGATIFAPLLAKKNAVYVLEDGTGSYAKKEDSKGSLLFVIKKYLHKIFFGAPDNFSSERQKHTSKIFYTGIGVIPEDVVHKSEIINIQNLWDNKNEEDKMEILRIYNFNANDLNDFDKRNIVLFTQTVSEDGLVDSEQDKIEIYRKALENVDHNMVIIKPHPRENTNYEKYFPHIKQIDGQIPFQLLDLLGVKLEKAITLWSTAVLSLNENIEIEWLGTTLSTKLKNRFGDMPISKYRN